MPDAPDALIWAYVVNASLLICHEMDSAFWREWRLFRLPGGLGLFLALHLPLMGAVLFGLVLLVRGADGGLWFSLGLAGAGLCAFGLHGWFLARGRPEFRAPMSLVILAATFVCSLVQGWLTLAELLR